MGLDFNNALGPWSPESLPNLHVTIFTQLLEVAERASNSVKLGIGGRAERV
jgi:hypothetical protein